MTVAFAAEPAWAWLVVCVAVPVLCSVADAAYRRRPSVVTRNVRGAVLAAAVASVVPLP